MRDGQANVIRLAVAQALAGANAVVAYATGAVVGEQLAPSPTFATLPLTVFVIGMATSTLPAGAIAQRYGRRTAFLVGTGCGALSGLVACLAVLQGSFALFCLAMLFGGAYAAVVLTFRFAAADCVEPRLQPRAMSLVMAGGVFAGILGPQLVTLTMNLWPPYLFAVTYLAQAAVAALSAIILAGIDLPRPTEARSEGRPLAEIARQPKFIAAVTCGMISYFLMNFMMTSAPLAMKFCGLPLSDSNLGLQWHVLAMYAPSFFTGRLIARYGTKTIVACGLVLIGLAAVAGLAGVTAMHFWLSMALVGLGWNFGFVGASALVLECHRPEEKTRVQSLNDFLVFGTMVIGSFASGGLLTNYGWTVVCLTAFPALAVAALALLATRAPRARMAAG